MTSLELDCMGEIPQSRPKLRLNAYLRERYRSVSAMAYDLRLPRKTAENLLVGCNWPSDTTFAALVRRFGKDLLEALFNPEIEPVVARLEEEERQLDRQLQAVRARRKQATGRAFEHPDLFEAFEFEALNGHRPRFSNSAPPGDAARSPLVVSPGGETPVCISTPEAGKARRTI